MYICNTVYTYVCVERERERERVLSSIPYICYFTSRVYHWCANDFFRSPAPVLTAPWFFALTNTVTSEKKSSRAYRKKSKHIFP